MFSFIKALPVVLLASGSIFAANIVTNGGFETGTTAGWTTVNASSGSDYGVFGSPVHSGSFSEGFGAVSGLDDAIFQTLGTSAGQQYTFSFWLDASQDVTGHMLAFWNGSQIFSTGPVAGGYQFYSFAETATGSSTVIEFAGNTPPSFYYLDDVCVSSTTDCGSVSSVPEPGTFGMLGGGFAGLGIFALRRKAAFLRA